jgi:hypothetical protein
MSAIMPAARGTMPTMIRRLFTALSIMSLALGAGTATMWWKSYRACYTAGWYTNHWSPAGLHSRGCGICFDSGGILLFRLHRFANPDLQTFEGRMFKLTNREVSEPALLREKPSGYPDMPEYRGCRLGGFGFANGNRYPPATGIDWHSDYFAMVPFWSAVLALVIPPAGLLLRRRGVTPGLCVSCRYSLTGNTSGVCPECGTPTTVGVKP